MVDEELEDLPFAELEMDPLRCCKIAMGLDGSMIMGQVEMIEQGMITKQRLYRVRYEDGDLEHFTREQLLRHLVSDWEEDERVTEGQNDEPNRLDPADESGPTPSCGGAQALAGAGALAAPAAAPKKEEQRGLFAGSSKASGPTPSCGGAQAPAGAGAHAVPAAAPVAMIVAEVGDEDSEEDFLWMASSLGAGQRPRGTAGGGKAADARTP